MQKSGQETEMNAVQRKPGTHNQAVGKCGEGAACVYLKEHGHTIIGRNWQGSHTEIDIISVDKNGLHFVEVKTRTVNSSGEAAPRPQDKVDLQKQKHLVQAAQRYIHNLNRSTWPGNIIGGNTEIFFDVVAVVLHRNSQLSQDKTSGPAVSGSLDRIFEPISLEYIPQAFIPMYF